MAAVQDLLDLILFYSLHQGRQGGRSAAASHYWVIESRRQLDHIEHRVELAQWRRKLQAIGIPAHLCLYLKGA
jgi:hypothetical protein